MLKLVVLLLAVSGASAQKVRQCLCSEVEPCRDAYMDSITKCMDQCQRHITDPTISFPKLRECLRAQDPLVQATAQCVQTAYAGSCAARPNAELISKRYSETFKMVAFNELNRYFARTGTLAHVNRAVGRVRKFTNCFKSCLESRTGLCDQKLACSLKLPADQAMFEQGKRCAVRAGVSDATLRQFCECVVAGGIRELAGVCHKFAVWP